MPDTEPQQIRLVRPEEGLTWTGVYNPTPPPITFSTVQVDRGQKRRRVDPIYFFEIDGERISRELGIEFDRYKSIMGEDMKMLKKKPTKKEKELEEESNLIRIDLDKAAKELAKEDLIERELADASNYEKVEEFLEVYDKYYDILFKSKA